MSRIVRWGIALIFAGSLVAGPLACERAADAGPRAQAEPPPLPEAVASADREDAVAAPESQGQGSYQEESFELVLEAPSTLHVGKAAEAKVVLKAKDPYKVNDEYPIKLTLTDSGGLTYPASSVGKEAVMLEAKKAVMKVAFTPRAAGQHTLAGRFSFSVCTDERCLIEKRNLAAQVTVR